MQVLWNIGCANMNPGRPAGEPAPAAEADAPSAPQALLRKVLVVDDEEDLAEMAAALLEARGLEVLVAYSAHEALRLLQENGDIDALFSDVVMPGMTGLQLAEAVTEMYPKVKVVLASGYTLPSLFDGRARPYLYTSKPYKIDAVLKLLHT
ncbi:response regulator [Massilia sp. 9096]|uniref:response regulator n=1 Tax=Massilia sp. 9096 TaxID=1500894 RepID=UPI000A49CC98|nr:response regulator [Massilia sp. 9096]